MSCCFFSCQEFDCCNFFCFFGGGVVVIGGFFLLGCSCSGLGVGGCCVVVFGFDGFDLQLIQMLIDQGCVFNFKKFMDMGCFWCFGMIMLVFLFVVWSSFIIGLLLGGYGIGDFIFRDWYNYLLVFLIFEMCDVWKIFEVVGCEFLMEKLFLGLLICSLCQGMLFWVYLMWQGIFVVVVKILINFFVDEMVIRGMGGMGMLDFVDVYGFFNYFINDFFEDYLNFSGGYVYYVEVQNGYV